ncbi:MAG: type II secretion system secretin GspD [Kiritimatiellae bacterium]|nr:type II secretion system secretin GspD [Kiritimatiellia bacterium]MDW8458820.1 type II secretion system secretin GspD [Verrucomicrobiota bacterium]
MIRPLRSRWARRCYTGLVIWIAAGLLPPVIRPIPVLAQPPPPPAGTAAGNDRLILLNFRDSPLDQVLDFVAENLLNRTIIKSPGLNASITLKSQSRLTVREALEAIEAVLAMNNISLVPMGEKFVKVVQTTAARQEGMPLNIALPDTKFPENDKLVSQVITLRHVEINEVTPIIQSLIHGYGKIQPLERANSLLVTDTAMNLARIMEILELIDQPVESKVETRIYTIRFAKASEIAARLNDLIADSQAKEEKPRVDTANIQVPPAIAALRPPKPEGEQAAAAAAAAAERGVITGKVRIIADERTNILFIISRPENFVFFDRIVEVLDRPIDPAIAVRVVALEYAKAEEIAGILNEFIGAAAAEKGAGPPAGVQPPTGEAADARGQALREFIQQRVEERAAREAAEEGSPGTFGRLSPNTKILADKRTNSLLLMGRKSDLDALLEVIDSLDIMLAQVLIEAVILEINLGKDIQSGVDWLQRSVTAYQDISRGPRGGLSTRLPVYSFGGGSVMSGGSGFRAGNSLLTQADGNAALSSGTLTYYLTFFDLNIDAIIRLAASSRDARILSTPVVLTTDNTEAKINIGEERPVVTSTSTTETGTQTQNYQYRNIGIDLSVTPRINPQRYVVMEISQKADNVGGFELINGNRVPVITKREINAQIAVQSRNTIVLGGLVSTDKTRSRTKVPLLGDIPLLGALFRSDSREEARTELLVLITPYVLMTPEEARQETVRLHKGSHSSKVRWHRDWSDSELPRLTAAQTDQILRDRQTVVTPGLVRDLFGRELSETPAHSPSDNKLKPAPDITLSPEPAAAPDTDKNNGAGNAGPEDGQPNPDL